MSYTLSIHRYVCSIDVRKEAGGHISTAVKGGTAASIKLRACCNHGAVGFFNEPNVQVLEMVVPGKMGTILFQVFRI